MSKILVQKKYDNESLMLVSDSILKRGCEFVSGEMLLDFKGYEDKISDIEKILKNDNYSTSDAMSYIIDVLENNNISYFDLSCNTNYSIEEIQKFKNDYTHIYISSWGELVDIEDIEGYEEIDYIECLMTNSNYQQIDVDVISELELIDENIPNEEYKFGQIDLYFDDKKNLYVHYNSYYMGDLGTVEETTVEELKEKFNYIIA